MDLDPEFADWYRSANVVINNDLIRLRWDGVVAALKSSKLPQLLDLVRYSFGRSPRSELTLQEFRKSFQAIDAAFGTQGNDHELRILSGAVIGAAIRQSKGALGDAAALAVSCMSVQGVRPQTPTPALVTRAEAYLRERAVEARKRPKMKDVPDIGFDLGPHIEAVRKTSQQSWNSIPEPVAASLTAVNSAVAELVKGIREVSALQHYAEAQEEELNILWWVIGVHSRDARVPLARFSLGEASLRAAKELADLTELIPGPASAEAFLSRVLDLAKGSSTSELTPFDGIIGTDMAWRKAWLGEISPRLTQAIELAADVCPISLGVRKSIEFGASDQWAGPFELLTGLQARAPMQAVKLAAQTYKELLLLRLMSEDRVR